MNIEIRQEGALLRIRILAQRLDGDNEILAAIKNGNYKIDRTELVEVDFSPVEFINSLGITELVNIHRLFAEANPEGVRLRFLNVDKKVNAILELVEIQKIAEIQVRS